ncbi:MAG: glycosyl hydrolase-related protein [Actinomycetota bacterium]
MRGRTSRIGGRQAVAAVVVVLGLVLGSIPAQPHAALAQTLSIVRVEPTLFFVRERATLLNVARAVVRNDGNALSGLAFRVSVDGASAETKLGILPTGESTQKVRVPDIAHEKARAGFALIGQGQTLASSEANWTRQRKWKLWLTPNSHVDLYATANAEYTAAAHVAALEGALSLAEKDAGYRFQIEDTIALEEFVAARPEKVEAMMARIRSGQIGLGAQQTGFHQSRATPESMVQSQFAFARTHYAFEKSYGVKTNAAMVFDVSSVAQQTPQLLRQSGVNYLLVAPNIAHRWFELNTMPYLSRWRSPDGSEVIAWRNSWGYGEQGYFNMEGYTGHSQATEDQVELLLRDREKGLFRNPDGEVLPRAAYPYDEYSVSWSYGDNGPANASPIEFRDAWNAKWEYPKVGLATTSQFLDRMRDKPDLPVVEGELLDNWAFIVANMALIDQFARAAKRDTLAAQAWWGLSSAMEKGPSPLERFRDVYANIAKIEGHDWWYGGIPVLQALGMETPPLPNIPVAAWDWLDADKAGVKTVLGVADLDKEKWARAARVEGVRLLAEGLAKVSALVSGAEPALAVFNPSGTQRTDIVFAPATSGTLTASDLCLVDLESNKPVSYQRLDGATYRLLGGQPAMMTAFINEDLTATQPATQYVAFVAKKVPAVGYRSYALRRSSACAAESSGSPAAELFSLDSPRYEVRFDASAGSVTSIRDKVLGAELVDQQAPWKMGDLLLGAPSTEVFDLVGEHLLGGTPLRPPVNQLSGASMAVVAGQTVGSAVPLAQGPVFASMLATGLLGEAPWTRTVTVFRDLDRIDVATVTEFNQPAQVRYMVAFPLAGNVREVSYEVPFGVHRLGLDDAKERGAKEAQFGPRAHRELVSWYEVGGVATESGARAKVAVSSTDAEVFTVGRPDTNFKDAATWEAKEPWYFPVIADSSWWSLATQGVYTNRFSISSAYDGQALGESAGHPLAGVEVAGSSSESKPSGSFFEVDGATLSVAKPPEDGSKGLIVRLYESKGSGGNARLAWDVRLGLDAVTPANLHEMAISGPSPAACDARLCRATLKLKAWEVRTIRLETLASSGAAPASRAAVESMQSNRRLPATGGIPAAAALGVLLMGAGLGARRLRRARSLPDSLTAISGGPALAMSRSRRT